jgi:predicted DCC family thiol-disulfide oxidoreductase YuxK
MTPQTYTVLFDGTCRICQRSRVMIERLRPTSPVQFVDVNDGRALANYPQMRGADALGQIHVLNPAGELSGGYDALVALAPTLPLFAWATRLLGLEPVRRLGRRAYRWVAANRYRLGGQASCHDGACQLKY